MKHGYPGHFLVFEGPNGAGKSTQVQLAAEFLRQHDRYHPAGVTVTKEPYTRTPEGRRVMLGEEIYEVLTGKHGRRIQLARVAMSDFQRYFYFPNRVQHYLEVVLPALKAGRTVLSDRGVASVCFGAEDECGLYGLMAEQLRMLGVLNLPWPDAIIIYDVPPEVAMERLRKSGKLLDGQETLEAQTMVRKMYRHFATQWPHCYIVDGALPPEEVFESQTRPILDKILGHQSSY